MKEIIARSKKYGSAIVMVDDEDFETLSKSIWRVVRYKTNEYAVSSKYGSMHRILLNLADNEFCDHKDGNGLNNQKDNLRRCTRGQNACNKRIQKNNRTGFKGVIATKTGKFMAIIQPNKKAITLGTFHTKIEAAKAYNDAAIKHFGEFAFLNDLSGNNQQAVIEKQNCLPPRFVQLENGEYAIREVSRIFGEQLIYLDPEDFEKFKNTTLTIRKAGNIIAACTKTDALLHRLVTGAKPTEVVRHIDRNGLNNRKSNLKVYLRCA